MISTQKINFVAFHVDLEKKVLKEAQNVAKAVNDDNHEENLNLMFSSVKRIYPKADLYVLTDTKSKFIQKTKSKLVRYDLDSRYPILARNKAWYQFLERTDKSTIFLDSDILINDNFDELMSLDFDIAFTFRDWEKWPINLGIIYVKNNQNKKTYKFFKDWYYQFLDLEIKQKVWGGDQDLIHSKFKMVDFSINQNFDIINNDLKIKFLICKEYNYSSEINEPMLEFPDNAKVLHFKGARKRYISECWRQMSDAPTS